MRLSPLCIILLALYINKYIYIVIKYMRHRMRQSATNNIRYTPPKCNQRLAYGLTELIRQYIVHFGVIFLSRHIAVFFLIFSMLSHVYTIYPTTYPSSYFTRIEFTFFSHQFRIPFGSWSRQRRPASRGCRARRSHGCWSSAATLGRRPSAGRAVGRAETLSCGFPAPAVGSRSTQPQSLFVQARISNGISSYQWESIWEYVGS